MAKKKPEVDYTKPLMDLFWELDEQGLKTSCMWQQKLKGPGGYLLECWLIGTRLYIICKYSDGMGYTLFSQVPNNDTSGDLELVLGHASADFRRFENAAAQVWCDKRLEEIK